MNKSSLPIKQNKKRCRELSCRYRSIKNLPRDCNKVTQPTVKAGQMMILFGSGDTVKEISESTCPNGSHLNTFTQDSVNKFEADEKYTPIWVRE